MTRKQSSGEGRDVPELPGDLCAWSALMAATAIGAIASSLDQFARIVPAARDEAGADHTPVWATPHKVRLELGTMALRDFSVGDSGVPALICAPFALHGATVADFAPRHSVVEALRDGGVGRVFVTDWRSAGAEMRFLTIDSYLADLNVAVDDVGAPVDLIGLCQGGWLAVAYAARFPHKVRRLVLVGAPIDIAAGSSLLSRTTAQIPLAAFEEFVRSHGGRVLGQRVLHLWGPALSAKDERRVLQLPASDHSGRTDDLLRHFHNWYDATVDLPGTYYLQTVSWLFKENRLAEGRFRALGRRIDLSTICHPIFMLAARDDELVHADQLFATARHVGTPKRHIETATEPCGHLSLFLGAKTLKRSWARIARWLGEDLTDHISADPVRSVQGCST
jgi:poly(3-hydroxyalkanoate) synthetase